MNNRNINKSLIALVGILLLSNIILAGYFLFSGNEKPKSKERKGVMYDFLQKEVGFSADQMKEYEAISKKNRTEARQFADSLQSTKTENLRNLGTNSFSDSSIEVAAKFAAMRQQELEKKMLNNIKAIRAICTPQQIAIFDSGFYKSIVRKPGEGKSSDEKGK